MNTFESCSAFLLLTLSVADVLSARTAGEIISKVKARSAEAELTKARFAYQRVSRVDYLDDGGGVKKQNVRVYQVTPRNGEPVSTLVEVNGRPATEKDQARRSAARETGDKTRGLSLGDDLLSRYAYTLTGEESVAGRQAWILEFSPRQGAPEDGFIDKLLNRMHGTLWVDQEDYELAKIDVQLGERVSFFGGLAGAIDKLDVQIVQKRLDSPVWLTEALTLDFSGRKLFSSIRFRCFESCSGFRKVAAF